MKTTIVDQERPGNYVSLVLRNEHLSERYFLLVLSRPAGFSAPSAGNFVHLLVPGAKRFFLRRPFSILYCTSEEIALLVLERGEGTHLLRRSREGSTIEFTGPLGNSFPAMQGKSILLVAGGVGLAPLYFARSSAVDSDCRLLYGGRTGDDLFLESLGMEELCSGLATEDGSYGFKGNVVQLARDVIKAKGTDVVFSCGPLEMLRNMNLLASETGIAHFVSLENRMACGLGFCRACVIPTRTSEGTVNKTVCHDGPVFDARTVVWDELPLP